MVFSEFLKNLLPSSLGRLNLFQVNIKVIGGGGIYGLDGRFEGIKTISAKEREMYLRLAKILEILLCNRRKLKKLIHSDDGGRALLLKSVIIQCSIR